MFIADIVSEVTDETDIINAYGFVVDFRGNIEVWPQEDEVCMIEMKEVMVAEEGVNRYGEEEPLLSDVEIKEQGDEVPICMATEEMTEGPTVITVERPVLITKLKEASIVDTIRQEKLAISKQNVEARRKNILDV